MKAKKFLKSMLLLSSLIAMVGCGGGGGSDSGESGNNPLSPAKDKFATKAEIQANIPGVWERYSIEKSTINGLTAVETSYRFVTFPNGDFRQFAHGTINNKPILCYSHGKYGISDGKILCNNRKISIECPSDYSLEFKDLPMEDAYSQVLSINSNSMQLSDNDKTTKLTKVYSLVSKDIIDTNIVGTWTLNETIKELDGTQITNITMTVSSDGSLVIDENAVLANKEALTAHVTAKYTSEFGRMRMFNAVSIVTMVATGETKQVNVGDGEFIVVEMSPTRMRYIDGEDGEVTVWNKQQ